MSATIKKSIIMMLALVGLVMAAPAGVAEGAAAGERPPNIIFILADDLGYGELGSYGQQKIRTPRLDQLAAEGIRFTQHYSASSVCAPARCALMTGKHSGHSFIRNNSEVMPEGQQPLEAAEVTVARLLKQAGYATAAIGKWGLGPVGSEGDPARHGFDLFFGYNCQRQAHSYYPDHLWHNDRRIDLSAWNGIYPRRENGGLEAGFEQIEGEPGEFFNRFGGRMYAPDLMIEQALRFIDQHRDQPFFLYYPTPVPHLSHQVPEDSLMEYLGLGWDEGPFLGTRTYLPHPAAKAAYAAMITRMDRDVGRLIDRVEALGLTGETVILFSSDNGPFEPANLPYLDFFGSTGGLRGSKMMFYEGGIRVPLIARWPGRIEPGGVSAWAGYHPDFLPTALELAGRDDLIPPGIDGISFAPELLGDSARQRRHEYLYWERPAGGGVQAVRMDEWKAIRFNAGGKPGPIELYHLPTDLSETKNVADSHPQIVERIGGIMREARMPSPTFPLRMLGEPGT